MTRVSAVIPVREDTEPGGDVEGEDHNEQNFTDYVMTVDRQQYD